MSLSERRAIVLVVRPDRSASSLLRQPARELVAPVVCATPDRSEEVVRSDKRWAKPWLTTQCA
jgi:hypothetical protein